MSEENQEQEVTEVHALDDAALEEQLLADDEGTPAEKTEREPESAETKEQEPAREPELTEVEKLAKQAADKESFIQKQAAEIGALRKQTDELQQRLAAGPTQEELDTMYYENPTAAVNKVLEIRSQQEQVNRLLLLANIKQNEAVTKEFVPDFEDLIPDMVQTLKDMKYSDDVIKGFQQDPYSQMPAIVVNLAERTRLAKENKVLKAEIESLKKAPGEALKKVEQAARQVVTGATGKAGGGAISAKQVHQMSTAEIEAALNEPDD